MDSVFHFAKGIKYEFGQLTSQVQHSTGQHMILNKLPHPQCQCLSFLYSEVCHLETLPATVSETDLSLSSVTGKSPLCPNHRIYWAGTCVCFPVQFHNIPDRELCCPPCHRGRTEQQDCSKPTLPRMSREWKKKNTARKKPSRRNASRAHSFLGSRLCSVPWTIYRG